MIKPWTGGRLATKAAFWIALIVVGIIAGLWLGGLGRAKFQKMTVLAETEKIPAFEVATYKIKSKSIGTLAEDKLLLGITYGTATLVYTYDAWVTLGVKAPESIKIRREGNEVYVDSSTIVVKLLDSKTENYQRIGFDTSNPLVSRSVTIDHLFGSQADDRAKAEALAIAEENMAAAKANFMDNYEKLCAAIGLKVNWKN
jgi:sRNA-binding carbon storage regulator CsrA